MPAMRAGACPWLEGRIPVRCRRDEATVSRGDADRYRAVAWRTRPRCPERPPTVAPAARSWGRYAQKWPNWTTTTPRSPTVAWRQAIRQHRRPRLALAVAQFYGCPNSYFPASFARSLSHSAGRRVRRSNSAKTRSHCFLLLTPKPIPVAIQVEHVRPNHGDGALNVEGSVPGAASTVVVGSVRVKARPYVRRMTGLRRRRLLSRRLL